MGRDTHPRAPCRRTERGKVSAASAGLAHRPFIGPARGSRLGCLIDRRVWVSGSSPPSQSRSARAQRSVRAVANRRGRPLLASPRRLAELCAGEGRAPWLFQKQAGKKNIFKASQC